MDIAITKPAQDFVSGLEKRLTQVLVDEALEWADSPQALSRWEDEHLVDKASPELLAQHQQTILRLLRFGRWLSVATSHPDFPDRETAELVEATLWTLQGMHDAWHKPKSVTRERADEILAAVFPDES